MTTFIDFWFLLYYRWKWKYRFVLDTLWFQLEDTVLLIGTLLIFDPVLFPIYEALLLIGLALNFEALSRGTLDKNNLAPIAYTFDVGVY